ncbi:MAG: transposase [Chloroflexi bacterium]|nr:transposase [Chloroflexota bacterium]
MQRTICLQLEPSFTQAAALEETSRQFTAAFNLFAQLGWSNSVSNATKLHFLAYYTVRAALPDLNSNLTNTARAKAAEALRSSFTLRKNRTRTVSMPRSHSCPPRYNVHTFRINWESQTVRLSLVAGRQTIRFRVPAYATKYVGYSVDTADLLERDGRWFLHVVVTVPAPTIAPSETVVGVDLGLSHPAVTSTRHFLGKKRWKAREGRLFKLKRALQKRNTKSAKRHLKTLRRKQARFRRDCDHVVSKQIVQSVEAGSTIVVENLTNIRKRMKGKRHTAIKRRLHSWSFAQLLAFIVYKAQERGGTVVAVDPRHTSQTCSCCGHQARNNRRSRAAFRCQMCSYELHADLNAAYNIVAKYHAQGGISRLSGLPVNQPIVSDPEPLAEG